MARVIKTEKMKKKNSKIKLIVLLSIVLVLLSVGVVVAYKKFYKKPERQKVEVVVLDSIDEYGYKLSDNDTDLYKNEYESLKKVLLDDSIDNKRYSEQVAKLFTVDLYTLSNKINKYDVGGKDFFYSDKVVMFEQKVMDSIYEHLLDNTFGDRKQELPAVNKIDVQSVGELKYKLGETTADCYQIKMKWTYEKSMGYDYQGTAVVCKENGIRWSVVDFQPTLEPSYK